MLRTPCYASQATGVLCGGTGAGVQGAETRCRVGDRAVVLYGFAKRERENIDADELLTLREIGAAWLAADARRLAQALDEDALQEVTDDDDET